jgi:hypothetical protein
MVTIITIISATAVVIIFTALVLEIIRYITVNTPKKHAIINALIKDLVLALLSSFNLLIYPYLIGVSCFSLTMEDVTSYYIF